MLATRMQRSSSSQTTSQTSASLSQTPQSRIQGRSLKISLRCQISPLSTITQHSVANWKEEQLQSESGTDLSRLTACNRSKISGGSRESGIIFYVIMDIGSLQHNCYFGVKHIYLFAVSGSINCSILTISWVCGHFFLSVNFYCLFCLFFNLIRHWVMALDLCQLTS